MQILKELWAACGDEDLSIKILALACVPITLYCVLAFDDSPWFDALQIFLNMVLLAIAFLWEDDDDET